MPEDQTDYRAIREGRYGGSAGDATTPSAAGIQEKSQQGLAALIAARKKKMAPGPGPSPSPSPSPSPEAIGQKKGLDEVQ
jgi:hypothetical protein